MIYAIIIREETPIPSRKFTVNFFGRGSFLFYNARASAMSRRLFYLFIIYLSVVLLLFFFFLLFFFVLNGLKLSDVTDLTLSKT